MNLMKICLLISCIEEENSALGCIYDQLDFYYDLTFNAHVLFDLVRRMIYD